MGDWAYEAHAAPCPGGPPWEWPTRSGGPENVTSASNRACEEQCSRCVSARMRMTTSDAARGELRGVPRLYGPRVEEAVSMTGLVRARARFGARDRRLRRFATIGFALLALGVLLQSADAASPGLHAPGAAPGHEERARVRRVRALHPGRPESDRTARGEPADSAAARERRPASARHARQHSERVDRASDAFNPNNVSCHNVGPVSAPTGTTPSISPSAGRTRRACSTRPARTRAARPGR